MYYLCSENKGAGQLCSYCIADLPLWFCKCILLVFWCGGSISVHSENLITSDVESLRILTVQGSFFFSNFPEIFTTLEEIVVAY